MTYYGHELPLMMDETPVGGIEIDLESGSFQGRLDKSIVGFLNDALAGKLISVLFYSKPATQYTPVDFAVIHDRFQRYLRENDPEFARNVIDYLADQLVGVKTREEITEEAKQFVLSDDSSERG